MIGYEKHSCWAVIGEWGEDDYGREWVIGIFDSEIVAQNYKKAAELEAVSRGYIVRNCPGMIVEEENEWRSRSSNLDPHPAGSGLDLPEKIRIESTIRYTPTYGVKE